MFLVIGINYIIKNDVKTELSETDNKIKKLIEEHELWKEDKMMNVMRDDDKSTIRNEII